MQPPEGLREKVKGLLQAQVGRRLATEDGLERRRARRSSSRAPTSISDALPIQRCWPGDPAPFITLPAVITKDPNTGVRNVGMYRMQVIDRRSTFMHWQMHKDGRADLLAAEDGRIPVAVAIGLDPVTAYSASAPLPKHLDELMLAGFLRGEPVELVRCKTVDLEVPANAEIVLEGCVSKDDVGIEGPFGDHTGYYSHAEPFPIFRISAMTMRRDAIYASIVVGKPPAEDAWLGKATERIFLPAVRMTLPEIVDYDLPVAGAFHNCVIVSIRKTFPGHAQKVMHALWGLGMLSLSKSIVVVDEHVDVHDYADVFFRVTANVDPKRDVLITEGPLDHLDHAPGRQFYGGKLGIDATHKLPEEDARPVAGGDRHGRRDPRARDPSLGRVRARRLVLTRVLRNVQNPPVATDGTSLTRGTVRAIESSARRELSDTSHDTPHAPGPSLWPIAFAIGVACLLVGSRHQLDRRRDRRRHRGRVRDPLGARRHARRARRGAGHRARDTDRRRSRQRRNRSQRPQRRSHSPPIRARDSSRPRRSASARRSAPWSRCPCSASRSCRRSRTSTRPTPTSGRSRTSRRGRTSSPRISLRPTRER